MQLLVLGINHATADVELRERLSIAPETLVEAKRSLVAALNTTVVKGAGPEAASCEAVILSTCNRTELVIAGGSQPLAAELVEQWLAGYKQLSPESFVPHLYLHRDQGALSHLLKVGCGLDSMVLGEPQILGQIKSAYATAGKAGTLGALLESVFQHVFSIVKQVRTHTAIGENPVSIAYAAVLLAQRIFDDFEQVSALLIGAGETIELVARHLNRAGVNEMTIANRTIDNAIDLANSLDAHAMMLADIPDELHRFDVVISSTGSQLPILGKGAVEAALRERKRKPVFLVDIAVPRDIEPQVAELRDAYLYSVDDLKDIIDHNKLLREQEAGKAEQIIAEGVAAFEQARQKREANDVVVNYRRQVSELSSTELARARQMLEAGSPPEQVLESFAHSLTRKLMHGPTVALRDAAGRQDHTTLEAARKLLSQGVQRRDKT